MATTRFIDHLLEGDHASRPAAGDVPEGTLYSCTTHSLVYQSDTSTWSTWATLGGSSDLDAIIAASSGQDIADALAGAAAPDAGNVFATMADVAGGAGAWTRLAEFDLSGGAAADFDFTSISGSYRHLHIVVAGRSAVSGNSEIARLQFNGDTGSNYDTIDASSAGNTSATEGSGRIGYVIGATATASYQSAFEIDIPFYADTNFYKEAIIHSSLPVKVQTNFNTISWKSTSAITRVRLFPTSANWVQDSRADLYGIN